MSVKRAMSAIASMWNCKNIITVLTLALTCQLLAVEGKEVKPSCDFQDRDVKYFDVRISPTIVPTNLTTYACQTRSIPLSLNQNYHAIGFLPLINNTEVVHHMILFGCPYTDAGGPIHACGPQDNQCRHFLVQWSRGLEGPICSHPEGGVKLGPGSFKSLALQIHWNNQFNSEGLSDQSGFRVFYTTRLRKHDMGNVQIGQNDLEIPPGQSHFPQTGSCSSECTKEWLPHPVYLTRAHIHMHYTGDGGAIQIIRSGRQVVEVVNDPSYDYDRPPAHSFSTPIKVLPGDEIRVTCRFNTRDGQRKRNETVYWGEGSDGEMCYAFVTYYPVIQDFDQCIQFDNYDICSRDGFAALGNCIFPGFIHVFEGIGDEIVKQCTLNNQEIDKVTETEKLCSKQCKNAIFEVTDHPCMQGRLEKEARRVYLPQIPIWQQVKVIMDKATSICHKK